jgi:hypothetical protein
MRASIALMMVMGDSIKWPDFILLAVSRLTATKRDLVTPNFCQLWLF